VGNLSLRQQNNSEVPSAAVVGIRARGRLEKRARIIDAAQAVFREKGYDAAGVRLIAARAGVSVGTVFEFSKDKRSLLLLVFGRHLEVCTQSAMASIDRDAPFIDQLIHFYRERYGFFYEDINVSLPLLREISFFFPAAAAADTESPIAQFLEKRAAGRAQIIALVEEQQARGLIDDAYEARDIAAVIIAVHQVEVREWLAKEHPTVADGLARLKKMLALALLGVMRPAAGRTPGLVVP
jgi:AcrR family transcriptional regulator